MERDVGEIGTDRVDMGEPLQAALNTEVSPNERIRTNAEAFRLLANRLRRNETDGEAAVASPPAEPTEIPSIEVPSGDMTAAETPLPPSSVAEPSAEVAVAPVSEIALPQTPPPVQTEPVPTPIEQDIFPAQPQEPPAPVVSAAAAAEAAEPAPGETDFLPRSGMHRVVSLPDILGPVVDSIKPSLQTAAPPPSTAPAVAQPEPGNRRLPQDFADQFNNAPSPVDPAPATPVEAAPPEPVVEEVEAAVVETAIPDPEPVTAEEQGETDDTAVEPNSRRPRGRRASDMSPEAARGRRASDFIAGPGVQEITADAAKLKLAEDATEKDIDHQTYWNQSPSEDATETVRALLDIMFMPEGASQPQEKSLAADTLLRVINRVPKQALVGIASRISMMEQPPALLVRRLMNHPDIEVSGGVLENCQSLNEQDIMQIILTGNSEKMRLLARRRSVSQAVCDELVERGDSSVHLTVVRNPGAQISHDSFILLAAQAEENAALQAPLATRGDTPAPIAFELFWYLPTELRRYVISRFLTDSATLNRILKITMAVDVDQEETGDMKFPGAGRIEQIVSDIADGANEKAAKQLSQLTGICHSNAMRVILDPDGEPFAVALKVLGCARAEFTKMLERVQSSEKAALRPDRHLSELENLFDTLSFNKAKVLFTYWDWAANQTGPYSRHAA